MAKNLVSTLEEDNFHEEKEKFFSFDLATLKRPGVIIRLIALAVCFIAIVLTATLPTVLIEYKFYSSSSEFDNARAMLFPAETIYGPNALFGGGYFAMYLKSNTIKGVHILTSIEANFNWVLFMLLVCMVLFIGLGFFVTFTKKMEKFSKLTVLGFAIGAFAAIASPVWFMVSNNIGNQYSVATTDLARYWTYDSFYCHCSWGAVVAALVFVLAAVLFAIGGGLENKGAERGR